MPLTVEHGRLAIAVARSNNEKIGGAATTYAAQQSCPTSCVFFNGGGCYAENGRIFSGVTQKLNLVAESAGAGPVDVAVEEAAAIDALDISKISGRPMRLHTVGDCRTDEAARIVAAAAERYMDRGGGPVWTYTHAWRLVDRASWGRVAVLASCETAEQIELARGRGYAPSIVVVAFEQRGRHRIGAAEEPGMAKERWARQGPAARSGTVGGPDILPCPAQTTEGVSCTKCRLCMDDGALLERGYAIAFAVHGTGISVRQAIRSLEAPSDPGRRLTSRDVANAYIAEHGYWPTARELADLAGVTWNSAYEMLGRLRAEHESTTSRSVT